MRKCSGFEYSNSLAIFYAAYLWAIRDSKEIYEVEIIEYRVYIILCIVFSVQNRVYTIESGVQYRLNSL